MLNQSSLPFPAPESWRAIPGYEGLYEVSDQGRVRRVKRGLGARPGRILGPSRKVKYPRVSLWRNAEQKTPFIHRLVAVAFLGPAGPGLEVNHIDGDASNPALSNLEYVTPRENTRHAIATGLRPAGPGAYPHYGEANGYAKLTVDAVLAIRASAEPSAVLAARHGVGPGTIREIRRRSKWATLTEENAHEFRAKPKP